MSFANVGGMDRALRLAIGAIAIGSGTILLGAFRGEVTGLIVSGVGVVMLLTGLVGFCPAYLPFGLSTCGTKAG
ncbi:MAG: DUF2892 domain-containing protein [Phycisphaerales bacterium]